MLKKVNIFFWCSGPEPGSHGESPASSTTPTSSMCRLSVSLTPDQTEHDRVCIVQCTSVHLASSVTRNQIRPSTTKRWWGGEMKKTYRASGRGKRSPSRSAVLLLCQLWSALSLALNRKLQYRRQEVWRSLWNLKINHWHGMIFTPSAFCFKRLSSSRLTIFFFFFPAAAPLKVIWCFWERKAQTTAPAQDSGAHFRDTFCTVG